MLGQACQGVRFHGLHYTEHMCWLEGYLAGRLVELGTSVAGGQLCCILLNCAADMTFL